METTEHIHKGKTFWANGKIVCEECVTPDDKGVNECFCKCHQTGLLACRSCGVFHVNV